MFKSFDRAVSAAKSAVVSLPGVETTGRELAVQTPQVADADLMRWLELKSSLHEQLLDQINLAAVDKVQPHELRREVADMISEFLAQRSRPLNSGDFTRIVDEVLDEILGLGPLEPLLQDPTVSDVLVNNHHSVYVERNGMLEPTKVKFKDERHLLRIIDKIVSGVGRRIDESQPWVDARLPDGSRVNAIIRPCAVDGPAVSIRKFAEVPLTLERLVSLGALSSQAADLIHAIVGARLNVLVSGGTGSGKTTMLNSISRFINPRERIVSIEDAAELQLQRDHIIRLETRPANIEGTGAVTQRDLVRNALRMRPDRIIIGEVRGGEALDMLQAMNTGHDGSMTTVHANTPRDALSRLEQMVIMSGVDFPMRSVRMQIAAAIHVVLQLERLSDGKRKVVSLQEVSGMEGDIVTMQEIFRFRRVGIGANSEVVGHFEATGVRPRFVERLEAFGFSVPRDMFAANRNVE